MKNKKLFKLFILLLFISILFLTLNFSCTKNINKNNCNNVKIITGLFKIYDNEYIIIVNPESKSRISYNLLNIDFFKKMKLNKFKDKMVKAKVCVVKKKSPWNIDAKLIEIKLLKK